MADLTSKSSQEDTFGNKVGSKFCKSESAQGSAGASPLCPECKSQKVWRDGIRYILGGEVQRWLCRDCALRFSISSNQNRAVATIETLQTKELKSKEVKDRVRQICAEGAKNLHAPKHKHLGSRELTDEEKATLKVFEGYLEKEGYRHTRYHQLIGTLLYLDADINNPEDVKSKIGAHPVGAELKCSSFMPMKLLWQ